MGPGTFDRSATLERLAALAREEQALDVVVIGGGITGAGVALDAASRGLRTLLVERDDLASGTSSRSSKLVHGGLRYLQQGDVRLVYEALAERQRLRRNAPHLVKVLPFLLPIFTRDGLFNRKLAWALGKAMWMYDLTGGARIGKLHQRLDVDEALGYMPTLPADRLAGAYLYYDATTDDARLTLTVARTAALDHGALVLNRAAVVGFLRDGERIAGVRIDVDGLDAPLEVRAGQVVSAAGVWSDRVRGLDRAEDPDTIRPAKGVHITVPWDKVRNEIAAVVPVPKDRRSVFVVPWGDQTYIGTTDTDHEGPLDDPRCTEEDVDYLLRAINGSVREPLTRDDITGTWAGLRPLVKTAASGRTADLSRRHRVTVDDDGLVTINGGKLTTYREMAEDTVDAVVERLEPEVRGRVHRRSRTRRLPLRGAVGYEALHRGGASSAGRSGLHDDAVAHLADRYGGEARILVAMVESDRALGERLVADHPFLRVEVLYAVRYEMALSVDDVLTRRVPLRLRDADAAVELADEVAGVLAAELGWDASRASADADAFRAAVLEDRRTAGLPAPPSTASVDR
ncbi:glycerol-3-phosphate dehydrogenase/oxidase [Actinomarinicola tropica]|uniref:Glycerol-3-phosphate dehydrogenase n=1 Tax=Actinomarinicola tropica TaxID=2789776 RepID=A0A5Q2RKY7_9ACTN|nr:glycerol-3-phosphate dehydrogenase/oxidase [Actinomarinicola tropica]QGG95592.1 FAD-dependent oxidoreductase [Actinomarinicola tropica]